MGIMDNEGHDPNGLGNTRVRSPQNVPVITDDMIRAACNAHGGSQGATEWEWMRDALTAALSHR
jgi:hypothetical protein